MSLLFPLYFLGLLGLALPWILHRFSDQTPPELLFPSKQFLESTTPPVSRKRTLRYRALLALRILSLLLLCLLFAQPWIKRDNLASVNEQHHMIVLDQSFSMQAERRWDAAIDQANELLQQLGNNSIELFGFDNQIQILASQNNEIQSGGNTSLQAVLNDLQPSFYAADYGVLMQRLDRLAADHDLPVKLWIISDMQASALPVQINALYAPNIRSVEFLPVGTDDQLNVHLMAEAQSTNGATFSVSVSLMASGGGTSTNSITRTVQIKAADKVLESRTIAIVPGELTVFSVDDLTLPASSRLELSVSLLESDALLADNEQKLVISSGASVGVVLLTSTQQRSRSAPVFMATVLETDSAVEVQSISGTVQQIPDDTSNLFVGRDMSVDIELDVLQYVDQGNSALVYNEAVVGLSEITDTVDSSDTLFAGLAIGSVNEAHPLALGSINWTGTRFFATADLQLQNDDVVLISLSSGQPLLIERSSARGRLLLLNDPLDGLASNLPLQPAFVDLMQSILNYFDASTSVPDQVLVGERLSLPANVQLIDAQGNALIELGDQSQSSSVELEVPGIYTALNARGEKSIRALLDPAEADLRAIEPDALNAWLARYANEVPSSVDNAANEAVDSEERTALNVRELINNRDPDRQALWRWLLPSLLLLVLLESWFANRRLNVRRDGS